MMMIFLLLLIAAVPALLPLHAVMGDTATSSTALLWRQKETVGTALEGVR